MVKITLIGAGSVVFAKNLVCDILQYAALEDCTLSLMDIDAGRLAVSEKLVRRIVAQLGVKARVEATTDLRKACTGARFVITTIQVGGYKPSTVVDFEIPAKYGVRQTIADTLGVGGVFRALRSIPKLVEVARMVQEVGAADPVLLNYTNPMAMNMWAIDRLTGISSVGLCHSVQGTSRQIAGYCGLDPADISFLVAGINHMAFFLKFEYKGKDAYPYLFQALEDPAVYACDRVRFEMMRRLGYFVTESSEHQSEYVPYFIHHGEKVIREFAVPINEYIRRCEAMSGRWDDVEKQLLDESKPVHIGKSVEYGSTIIHSIVSGQPSVIYGNVPNRGLITNVTQGASVEVPCLVDKQGIQPTHIGALPPQLAAIIHTNLNVQELTVEAAITGQREYIYQAVMHDPHTATVLTLDQIWAMCDEMIEAHQRDGVLGEFKPVIRNTGRPSRSVERVFLSIRPEGAPFAGDATTAAFSLVAENRSPEPFSGAVQVVEKNGRLAFSCADFQVNLAAGETASFPFGASLKGGANEELTLSIISDSLRTLERDSRFPARKVIDLPLNGSEPYAFRVEWSGNVVAECALSLTDEELFLEAQVDDTDARTEMHYPDGSAVEIALKDARSDQPRIWPLVVLPDRDRQPRIWQKTGFSGGDDFEGACATVEHDANGYRLKVRINRAKAGIGENRPFLCDIAFHVNALGTAHGKIRHSWQESGDLRSDQSRFVLLNPVVAKA